MTTDLKFEGQIQVSLKDKQDKGRSRPAESLYKGQRYGDSGSVRR